MNTILRLAATVAFATAVPTAAFAEAAPAADAHQHGEKATPAGQNAPDQAASEQPAGDEPACKCADCMKMMQTMMQTMMEHMSHPAEQAQPSKEDAPEHRGH